MSNSCRVEGTERTPPRCADSSGAVRRAHGCICCTLREDLLDTVVDAAGFVTELVRGDGLAQRDLQAADGDERSISDLLVDQVEFADMLVLNKTDLVGPDGLGWAAELAGSHIPETEEYGISSVVYRAARPFHAAQLLAALEGWDGVPRSKGFCRIATRPDVLAVWSQAGPDLTFEPGEIIGASAAVGQELVFIGVGVTVTDTYRRLDPALLTGDELAAGPDAWRALPDPLPLWATPSCTSPTLMCRDDRAVHG